MISLVAIVLAVTTYNVQDKFKKLEQNHILLEKSFEEMFKIAKLSNDDTFNCIVLYDKLKKSCEKCLMSPQRSY